MFKRNLQTINLREAGKDPQEPIRPLAPGLPIKWWHRRAFYIIFIALVALAWLGFWYIGSGSVWRAVFLSNNQVYFGHFRPMPFMGEVTLRDVYYLQVTQPGAQLSGEDQSQLKLVKLGNEIHGPTSEMVIPMGQVLFWETLRSDSAIVRTISQAQIDQAQASAKK